MSISSCFISNFPLALAPDVCGESSSRSCAAFVMAAICEENDDCLGAFNAALSELLIPLPRLAIGDVTMGVDGAGDPPRDEDTDLGPTLICWFISLGMDVVIR